MPWPISRGDFLNVAIGVNRLRNEYPMLAISCEVRKRDTSGGPLGGVSLLSWVR